MNPPGGPDLDTAAALLRADPAVHDAVLLRDNGVGVLAVVVPQGYQLGGQLREKVLDLVGWPDDPATAGVPCQVLVVAAIPRDPEGRADTVAVFEALHEPDAYLLRFETSRSPSERRLLELAVEVMPGVRVSMTDSLPQMGADSVAVMALVGRIHEEFGLDVDPQDAFEAQSLRDLAAMLDALPDGATPVASR